MSFELFDLEVFDLRKLKICTFLIKLTQIEKAVSIDIKE